MATLLTYDLASAAQTGSYPLPGGRLCNDIAVAADGTAYITDTSDTGRVLALAPGGTELTVVIADTAIAGIDGIAYIGDVLYANDVMTGAIYRARPCRRHVCDADHLASARGSGRYAYDRRRHRPDRC